MKKKILLLLAFLMVGNCVFATTWTYEMKRAFYDNFYASMYDSMAQSLLQQGFNPASVSVFVEKSKANFNQTELENKTFGCVSQYSPEEIIQNPTKMLDACFTNFAQDFVNNNSDLAKTYLRK